MENLIILAVLAAIIGGAAAYVRKEKKKGSKCIGCPAGASCSQWGNCSGNCTEK